LGVLVRAWIEKQPRNKHVESLKTRRLDEGSNPSDSTFDNGLGKQQDIKILLFDLGCQSQIIFKPF